MNPFERVYARLRPAAHQARIAQRARDLELLRYGDLARSAGVDRLYLFLSFDCDTDLDIAVVERLHERLAERGIRATYAVPGAQLRKGGATYRRVAEAGGEFMNHGALPHTEWQGDRWVGRTFYAEMPAAAVVEDIHRGHAIVGDVIGVAPRGFRAPHFGCYQQPEQLARLHTTAAALGCTYCSTTLPQAGLERGPVYATSGLLEFPCSGSARNPLTLLDSWTYLTDRKDYRLGDEYHALAADTVATYLRLGIAGVLTWYADPCHVFGQAPFEKTIDALVRAGVTSVTGSELTEIVTARLPQPLAS